jgi:predicted phosphodiesterase
MPKVLLVGDLHGQVQPLSKAFHQAVEEGVEAIIQLGDYGFGWSIGDDEMCDYSYLTATMADKTGVPFYWVDGNHENFDRLYSIDPDENGHRTILEGVTHLGRGSTITIGETTFLAMGGAYSVDAPKRKPGKSWWPQETITDEEVERAVAAGPAHVVLSHDAPYGLQDEGNLAWLAKTFGPEAVPNSLANQQRVLRVVEASGARELFHGHLHRSYTKQLPNGCIVTCVNLENEKGSRIVLDV